MKVKVKSLSCVRLFATPWTVARQAPPSMGFSKQEYWSGLPFPSPGVQTIAVANFHSKQLNTPVYSSSVSNDNLETYLLEKIRP